MRRYNPIFCFSDGDHGSTTIQRKDYIIALVNDPLGHKPIRFVYSVYQIIHPSSFMVNHLVVAGGSNPLADIGRVVVIF
jgi:hypothetical protein